MPHPPTSLTRPIAPQNKQAKVRSLIARMGFGAFTISLVAHIIFAVIAIFFLYHWVYPPEETVDFLPGGGGGGGGSGGEQVHKIQQQQQKRILNSADVAKRIASTSTTATFSLPDSSEELVDPGLPVNANSAELGSGGGIGGGHGKGVGTGTGSGSGAGIGKGIGFGAGLGVKMFGLKLEGTSRIAVVMDVSRSMTKYLPLVTREMDKLPSSAPLVLYFGCGLAEAPRGKKIDEKIRRTNVAQFDRFWQLGQGKTPLPSLIKDYDSLKFNPQEKMPLAAMYKEMSSRPDSYFLDFNGIFYTQEALICEEVRDADTIYWFSDFQDKVDDSEIKSVLRKFKSRHQKLIMHAPMKGKNFDKLKSELAIPSGGQAIFKELK